MMLGFISVNFYITTFAHCEAPYKFYCKLRLSYYGPCRLKGERVYKVC